jgi:hypothetical protein
VEVTHILWGYQVRLQQQLIGPRLTAYLVYKANFENPEPMAEFFPLPLVDTATPTGASPSMEALEKRLTFLRGTIERFGPNAVQLSDAERVALNLP